MAATTKATRGMAAPREQCIADAIAAFAYSGRKPVSTADVDCILTLGKFLYQEGRRNQNPNDAHHIYIFPRFPPVSAVSLRKKKRSVHTTLTKHITLFGAN